MCRDNRFAPLQSRVCRRIEEGYTACPVQGKTQPVRSWRCGGAGHVL